MNSIFTLLQGRVALPGFRVVKHPRRAMRGFSLVEILATVAVLSSLTAVGMGVVSHVQIAAVDSKLEQDVRQVNKAIQFYLASGGNLNGVTEPQQVLEKLKTRASAENALDRQIMFLKEPVIDLRLRAVTMDEQWTTGRKWAAYDAATQRFQIVESSASANVKGFALDKEVTAPEGEVRHVVFKQAVKENWVWDHGSDAVETTTDVPTDSPTDLPSQVVYSPAAPVTKGKALAPVIHPQTASLRLRDFPLSVTLSDPNPAGATRLYCRVGGAGYHPYEGAIVIEPGTDITGYAASNNSENLHDSESVEQRFAPDPVQLRLKDNLPASVTYFALGGAAAPGSAATAPLSAHVTLDTADEIPARYQSSANFRVNVSYNQRVQLGAAFEGGFAGERLLPQLNDFANGKVTISYQAQAQNTALFVSSAAVAKNLSASVLPLVAPKAALEGSNIVLTPDFAGGALPANYRIYYRFGTDPGDVNGEPANGATAYTDAIPVGQNRGMLYARVYPPSAYKAWFSTSGVTTLQLPEAKDDEPWEMGDYNVIVFNDLYTTTAVEGKSWIGGNLTNNNSFSMGRNYSPSKAEAVVVVGTSVGSGNAFHMEGNANSRLIVTNQAARGSRSINWNGGGSESTRLGFDAQIPAKTAAMKERYIALSQGLAQVSANSSLVTPPNQGNKRVFQCVPNSDGIAVFNISAASFFEENNITADIEMASGHSFSSLKGILVNVTGTSVNTKSSFNFSGNFNNNDWSSKLVWNFSQATSMDMSAQWVGGNVLAPKSFIVTRNNFRGNVVCNALELRGTCERRPFNAAAVFALAE